MKASFFENPKVEFLIIYGLLIQDYTDEILTKIFSEIGKLY